MIYLERGGLGKAVELLRKSIYNYPHDHEAIDLLAKLAQMKAD